MDYIDYEDFFNKLLSKQKSVTAFANIIGSRKLDKKPIQTLITYISAWMGFIINDVLQ